MNVFVIDDIVIKIMTFLDAETRWNFAQTSSIEYNSFWKSHNNEKTLRYFPVWKRIKYNLNKIKLHKFSVANYLLSQFSDKNGCTENKCYADYGNCAKCLKLTYPVDKFSRGETNELIKTAILKNNESFLNQVHKKHYQTIDINLMRELIMCCNINSFSLWQFLELLINNDVSNYIINNCKSIILRKTIYKYNSGYVIDIDSVEFLINKLSYNLNDFEYNYLVKFSACEESVNDYMEVLKKYFVIPNNYKLFIYE